MMRRRNMRVIELETMDGCTVGQRCIGRADLFMTREQRRWSSPTHGDGDVCRKHTPWLCGTEQATAQGIKETGLHGAHHILRDVDEPKPGHPFAQLGCNRNGGC